MGRRWPKPIERLLEDAAGCGPSVSESLAQSHETLRRIGLEDSNTRSLLWQLSVYDVPEPRSKFHEEGQLAIDFEGKCYRFDLAWEEGRLLVELQGLKGHTRIAAYIDDCKKAAAAATNGWTLLPVVSPHIKSGEAAKWIHAYFNMQSEVARRANN